MTTPEELASTKHLLDTSVVYGVLAKSAPYKDYYRREFSSGRVYVGRYVRMEFIRSHISSVIQFGLLLGLPSIPTVEDALKVWADKFGRDPKVGLYVASEILAGYGTDINDARDKRQAIRVIGSYIQRLEMKLRRSFTDPGRDTTHCARAEVEFPTVGRDVLRSLEDFSSRFNDVAFCRSKCKIHESLFNRHKSEADMLVKEGDRLQVSESKRKTGFPKIASDLKDALSKGEGKFTCATCGKIGDAIIALDADRTMRLEHVDASFDQLCPPLGQPHFRHPAQITYVTKGHS